MKKQVLMLVFAGMVALPFIQHTASAQVTDSQFQQAKQKSVHVSHQPLEEFKSHYKDLYAKIFKGNTSSQQPTTPIDSNGSPVSSSQKSSKATGTASTYAKNVVTLTNKERTSRGLKPLTLNTKLSKMARDKSLDMVNKHYFSHQSPTFGSPFDMMRMYNISYTSAGENIAAGQKTPQEVVTAWMNSEGHRENILNPNYTAMGVGYVKGGSYGSYWTQEFIGK